MVLIDPARSSIVEAIPVDGSFRNGYAQAVLGMPAAEGYQPLHPYPPDPELGPQEAK